ncbi:unnamed protein product, partial [Musa textilis]
PPLRRRHGGPHLRPDPIRLLLPFPVLPSGSRRPGGRGLRRHQRAGLRPRGGPRGADDEGPLHAPLAPRPPRPSPPVTSSCPGGLSTVDAICGVAKSAGGRVFLLTARPGTGGGARGIADAVAYVPAQTMADDEEEGSATPMRSVRLPMGSVYEGAMYVLFEMAVLRLTEALKQTPGQLRSRHTNLE